jgi:hypothetical protein
MEKLQISGDVVYWGDRLLIKEGYENVDNQMVHITFNECTIGFKAGETEINGVIKNTVQEIIDSL